MTKKIQVVILFGGHSAEHEISIISARNVFRWLDKAHFELNVVYITQEGNWYLVNEPEAFLDSEPRHLIEQDKVTRLLLAPGNRNQPFVFADDLKATLTVDCIFPVLHGTYGEDGTMQGLLDILGVPYVGCGTLSAAISMDKNITKRLLASHDILTSRWLELRCAHPDRYSYADVKKMLGEIVFVKPANLGSSVGISKVKNETEYKSAIKHAFKYCQTVTIEEYIKGREIECSVIGNHKPVASLPGEVVVHHEFYSYEAKYLDKKGADIVSPADLPAKTVENIQRVAKQTYEVLQCSGLARIDFFVTADEEIYVNEVNPIPGVTPISLFIKNWVSSGLVESEVFSDLIELALQRHHELNQLFHIHAIGEGMSDEGENVREGLE